MVPGILLCLLRQRKACYMGSMPKGESCMKARPSTERALLYACSAACWNKRMSQTPCSQAADKCLA